MENPSTDSQKLENITPSSTSTPPSAPSSSKRWLWIIIIIAAVVAASAGGYWWWQNKSAEPAPASSAEIPDSETDTAPSPGWSQYENVKYHYSIEYPNDWDIHSLSSDMEPPPIETSDIIGISKGYDNDDKIANFTIDVKEDELPRTPKEVADNIRKTYDDLEIFAEGETTLDGVPAYYITYHYEVSGGETYVDGEEVDFADIHYFTEILALKDGYLYTLVMNEQYTESDEYPVMPPDVPYDEWQNIETFDKMVETFKFRDFVPPEINTGCLEMPLTLGNTWKYRTTATGPFNIEAASEDTTELTAIRETEYVLDTTVVMDGADNYYVERYGFDSTGDNMYLNHREVEVNTEGAGNIASGSLYYQGFKVFSCQEDEWPLDVDIATSKLNFQFPVSGGGDISKMTGTAKVLDRNAEVTIPAGTFEAVIVEIDVEEISATTTLGEFSIPAYMKIWFVPGIGKVKQESTSAGEETIELLEYDLK
ncbi:PsbP-related protein [Patescibacteria group bacterium]